MKSNLSAISSIPSLAFIAIAVVLTASTIGGWYSSGVSEVPYPALLLITPLLAAAAYLAHRVLTRQPLAKHNGVIVPGLVCIVLTEFMLRLNPYVIPNVLLPSLPRQDARRIGEQRGFLTANTITGEDMLYQYKPHQTNERFAHLLIDEIGFRNPPIDKQAVDAVLLGDSMILAQESEVDLGALFRDRGVSAMNLGMGGYAPQHYRDVYKKLIIEQNVEHRHTLIFLFAGNDFGDVRRYESIRSSGGAWQDYLQNETTHSLQDWLPWTLDLVMATPEYIRGRLLNPTRSINLPYEQVDVGYLWWPPAVTATDDAWRLAEEALTEIIDLSRHHSAEPIIFFIPSPATLFSQFEPEFAVWDANHATTSNTISTFARSHNVSYIDLNAPLRADLRKQFILFSPRDCHFNAAGVRTLFEAVAEHVPTVSATQRN